MVSHLTSLCLRVYIHSTDNWHFALSDPVQRRQHDYLHTPKSYADKSNDTKASVNFFSPFTSMFSNTSSINGTPSNNGRWPNPENVFADTFRQSTASIQCTLNSCTQSVLVASLPGGRTSPPMVVPLWYCVWWTRFYPEYDIASLTPYGSQVHCSQYIWSYVWCGGWLLPERILPCLESQRELLRPFLRSMRVLSQVRTDRSLKRWHPSSNAV